MELATVEAVASGYALSIRRQDERAVAVSLSVVLQQCARSYCGAGNADSEVFEEGVDFVMSQFGHLGIEEVQEAFRLGAAGKIEIDLRSYYGAFPLVMLGELLRGYGEYRKRILSELRKAESDAHYQAEYHRAKIWWESPDGQRAQEEFQARRIERLRATENPTTELVTAYDYSILVEHGHIALTPAEKRQLMKDAVPLLKHELISQQRGSGAGKAIEAQKMLAEMDSNEDARLKQKVIAQRLAVVRWIEAQRASQ